MCLDHQNRNSKEKLIVHDIPDGPWRKVAADLFTIYGKDYVLVVDYYSKFFEITSLETTSSNHVINALKKIFSRYGIPQLLFTDNGPQFTAEEFRSFIKEWDFDHDTSSPHYPQSNGLVERKIQTVKKTLKKAFKSDEDLYLALLALNSTVSSDGTSPAFKMFGRQIRTTLPSAREYVKKNLRGSETEHSYNKHANDLPEIVPGTTGRIRTDKDGDWTEHGIVMNTSSEPRSYCVKNSKGNIVQRNRKHLLPTKETFKEKINYDDLNVLI